MKLPNSYGSVYKLSGKRRNPWAARKTVGWKQIPEKKFQFIQGGCPTHLFLTREDMAYAKEQHPDALVLVHPECRPEVTDLADYAGSTTGIMSFAEKSDAKEFIIGTENSIVEHLQFQCPDKRFYPLSKNCICRNMKLTTLMGVYNCLLGRDGEEIHMDETLRRDAMRPIENMLKLGG